MLNLQDWRRIWLYLSLNGSLIESSLLSYGTDRRGCMPEIRTDVDCTKNDSNCESNGETISRPAFEVVTLSAHQYCHTPYASAASWQPSPVLGRPTEYARAPLPSLKLTAKSVYETREQAERFYYKKKSRVYRLQTTVTVQKKTLILSLKRAQYVSNI